MKVLIFGAGAVGAYFGGRLAQAGADVSVVGRSDYEEIKANGFDIKSIKGDFHFTPNQVVRSAAEYQGKADLLLVASKVLPEIDVPAMIRDAVHPGTVIMLAQNGIAIENDVHAAFPDNELWRAVLYIGCTKVAPAKLNHSGGLGSITFGKFDGLHKGHEMLIQRVVEHQQKDDVVGIVCAFDMSQFWKKQQKMKTFIMWFVL